MDIPKLGEGKFALILANFETGIILNINGSYFLGDDNIHYIAMNSEQAAIDRAREIVESAGNIEIMIYNGTGELIQVVRPTDAV